VLKGEPGKMIELGPGPGQIVKPSEYWLGLECYPVEGALRTQLRLPEGQGLVVEDVVPDSPAAEAKVQKHDVLLKAGGKPLATIVDLMAAVDEAQQKKLTLEIIRQAKPKKIEVVPAKRPERAFGQRLLPRPFPAPGNPDLDALRKWYEKAMPEARPPMRFRFFQPGMILPPGAPVQPPLPGNMSVAITKQADAPAKISVQRGDQKWEVTEKELDKLPDDVRPHVQRMLGHVPARIERDVDVDVDILPPRLGPGPAGGPLQKQLDAMSREIEELRKAVQGIHGKPPKAKEPRKPAKK